MTTIPQLSRLMKRLLGPVAYQLAKQTGFVKRERVLTGSLFAQILVFSWWQDPAATCEQRSDLAHLLGCPVSSQAIDQRFNQAAADFMQQLLLAAMRTAVEADPVNIPVLRRFSRVEIADASSVILPDELASRYRGCGTVSGTKGASLKLLFRFELTNGRLLGPLLADGRSNERTMAAELEPPAVESLQIADLGFFSIRQFAAWEQARVYWLSRYKNGTHLFDRQGQRLDLLAWLRQHCRERADLTLLLGAKQQLPCRLLAERVPDEVLRQRQEELKEEARKESQAINPMEWELARWTLLITNCTPQQLSIAEGLGLEQARWQVELLIKRNKSLLEIDEWHSKRAWRVMTEVYTKLLIGVLQHWLLVVGCWANPDRSLWQSQQVLRSWGRGLARAFGTAHWLGELQMAVEQAARRRMEKRRKDPGLWQILLAADPPAQELANVA